MTVAELIAALQKMPASVPVVVRDNEGRFAEEVLAVWHAPKGGNSDELAETCMIDGPVVVIA